MDGKGGKGVLRFTFVILCCVVACCVMSCREKRQNPNHDLSLAYYATLSVPSYVISPEQVRREVLRLAAADKDTLVADYYAKSHYSKRFAFVWIDRKGIDHRADSVLARLRTVEAMGFNPDRFRIGKIDADLRRARELRFDGEANGASSVYARLEYNLTKAYFRFATGQYFGYSNPSRLLNRLDRCDVESPYPVYQTLCAIGNPSPQKAFYAMALRKVRNDSAAVFLDSLEPRREYYRRLARLLRGDSVAVYGRRLLMVNMERCRWRMSDYPERHGKYVIVNIPSFHLRAVDGDNVLLMRMGCGSRETKTPMLHSNITRVDINPQWIMPRSIVRSSVLPQLGNSWFFKSRRYFVRERSTGKNVDVDNVTREMLESGDYLVIQEGGEGNSLGRMVFRFANDLSIYIHDTPSKSVFSRESRDVSHGCIRVERPFDLAVFLVGDGDAKLVEKIRYSVNADVSSVGKARDELTDGQRAVADTLRRGMLVGRVGVKPRVPLFIVYFTLYPDADGTLRTFRDVYGYDEVIYRYLGNYM